MICILVLHPVCAALDVELHPQKHILLHGITAPRGHLFAPGARIDFKKNCSSSGRTGRSVSAGTGSEVRVVEELSMSDDLNSLFRDYSKTANRGDHPRENRAGESSMVQPFDGRTNALRGAREFCCDLPAHVL